MPSLQENKMKGHGMDYSPTKQTAKNASIVTIVRSGELSKQMIKSELNLNLSTFRIRVVVK